MSCQICCSNYNKSIRSEIKCYFENCNYSACKECIRTYLTTTVSEPHCMKCRNKWSLEFTKSSLNASFMESDYREHRRNILADRAIAQIPEYYEAALRYGKISEGDKKLNEIMEKIGQHRTIIGELYREYDQVRREMDNKAPTESRKFVMQCQTDGCRGMLSTQYKCDICTKFTCPKCFLSIDGEKADHVCKQEDIETVEELRKNTKPCPNCGLRISKIDGCDQMWCIECKTAFSWNKGTIEKGVVHNPHYYQWMRQNGGVQRNPNEHNEACGNIFGNAARRTSRIIQDCLDTKIYYQRYCDNYKLSNNKELYKTFSGMLEKTANLHGKLFTFEKYFSKFHRFITHIEYTELRPLTNNIRLREENRNAIYQYILNQINKDKLSDELIRADNLIVKERAHSDIIEALIVVGKQLVIDCLKDLEQVVKDFHFYSNYNAQIFSLNVQTFMKEFEEKYIYFLPSEVEAFHIKLCEVFNKYKCAISKYCAYSNIEATKFLITYGSKKTLILWEYEEGNIVYRQFKTKSEMTTFIDEEKKYYDKCELEEKSQVSKASQAPLGGGYHA